MKISALNQSQNYQYNTHFQGKVTDLAKKAVLKYGATADLELAKACPIAAALLVHDTATPLQLLGIGCAGKAGLDIVEMVVKHAVTIPHRADYLAWSKLNVIAQLDKMYMIRQKLHGIARNIRGTIS